MRILVLLFLSFFSYKSFSSGVDKLNDYLKSSLDDARLKVFRSYYLPWQSKNEGANAYSVSLFREPSSLSGKICLNTASTFQVYLTGDKSWKLSDKKNIDFEQGFIAFLPTPSSACKVPNVNHITYLPFALDQRKLELSLINEANILVSLTQCIHDKKLGSTERPDGITDLHVTYFEDKFAYEAWFRPTGFRLYYDFEKNNIKVYGCQLFLD